MCKRLFYLITFVLALGFAAGVAIADPVVYELTADTPAGFGGTITWDVNVGLSFADGGITAFSLVNPVGTTDTYDETDSVTELVIGVDGSNNPISLLIDIDDAQGGWFLYTDVPIDFTTGLGHLDNPAYDITGAAMTPVGGGGFDFDPTPGDGATVVVADPLALSWLNLPADPCNVADSTKVDVYWDTLEDGSGGTQVLTESPEALTVDVTADAIGTYYWKIVATDPNTGGTPVVTGEAVYSLITESTNLAPTITVTPLALDYEWLVGGTKTMAIAATVTDADGIGDHTYTYRVAAGSPTAGATFGTIALSNDTGTGVDLSADVTFTTAGDYILEVEVNDNDVHYITDTVNVTVYADGCEAAKIELPYSETEAGTMGDTNYDCEVNLVDLAAMALNWLDNVSF
ncbi:MAG: hypothetical protein FVQ82_13890 [Planctomycetes bacterium]|nr:hypothetical protein [Planctomycetota bacterium]